MVILFREKDHRHGYHLVDSSPWPLIGAFSALSLTFGSALYLHGYSLGGFLWKSGFLLILFVMYVWWGDIVRESTFEGQHTGLVQQGIKIGFILFIVSEVMFFFGFFWAFFHSSFNPSSVLGAVWPPFSLATLNPWKVPLLNTIILLSSGASVTWAHNAIINRKRYEAMYALKCTIGLAVIFTSIQIYEYITSGFNISDSVYGSVFYLATGFHGLHVFIGTCFLTVCLIRLYYFQYTAENPTGFEAAAWYWHFVDVVWLFLFIAVYWWGS